MADQNDRDTPQPMAAGAFDAPPADAAFQPAEPLKDAGVDFTPSTSSTDTGTQNTSDAKPTSVAGVAQLVRENTQDLRGQATDKARLFVEDGKSKATDALGQLSQLLSDAADQVDEKLGGPYGQYARSASERVNAFSSSLDDKSVDELFDDARELVKKSPGVAVGVAAAVGFVVARLLSAGVEQRNA